MLRIRRVAITLTLALSAIAAAPALAVDESGDAGPLPASAQDLGQAADLGAIAGSLASAGDVDAYRVCLSPGAAFSAGTVGGSDVDTQLFLFDAEGRGVYANDDASAAARQSLLPAGDPLTPTGGGVHHLAISGFDLQPWSAAGAIFPNSTLAVTGPTGEGGGAPVERWSGRAGTPGGDYRIALSGVVACPRPDKAAPGIELRSPAEGASFARGAEVAADYDCADEAGGSGLASCEGTVPAGARIDTATLGPKTFTVTARDSAGNSASASHTYTVEDRDDPVITIASPPDGAVYLLGQQVTAGYECADEAGGSGLSRCEGDLPAGTPIDTTRPGTHVFTVRARDAAGNEAVATSVYHVRFDFRGFLGPLLDPPAVNVVRAGRIVRVAFSLGGPQGLDVLAGRPWSQRTDCETGAPLGQAQPARSVHRRRPLRYRRRGARYQLLWRTERAWAGSCRRLVVSLADGSEHTANFRFTRRARWRGDVAPARVR